MSADDFNYLLYERQLAVVYAHGRYLAMRLEQQFTAVNLQYFPGGLFVELYYHLDRCQITRIVGFADACLLHGYRA